jgi:Fic family protein
MNIKSINISPQMLAQIAEIEAFNAAWQHSNLLKADQLKALRKVSTIESVGSSNRIEGNKLTDAEIEDLLSNLNRQSFKSRDEEEVAGYAQLMDIVFDDYMVIPLSENYIKQLHQILLKFVSKDERHRGEYKKLVNSVAAYDTSGKEIGIVFETASPFDTPRLMADLVSWTNRNLADPFLHPLIVIAVFIVHFLAIHPFQDGNGRLSRALTTMLLLKSNYSYVPYSSIESIIEASKEGYYRALRKTQKNIWSDEAVDYEPWVSFFLTTLQKQKQHLEAKIKMAVALPNSEQSLGKNARAVLALFNDQAEWGVSAIASALNLNKNTVATIVKTLVHNGYLAKHGATRGAWYEKVK